MGKFKSLLPGSSRSLHAMHEDVLRLTQQNEELKSEVAQLKEICQGFERRFSVYEEQALGLLWGIYKADDETVKEAKIRFFKSLPAAEGAMREHQMKLYDLLKDFDSLCKANGIDYFLAVGTLLGAIRHGGFIPWDDDMDVGVMREDVDALMRIVEDDDRFEITTVYDQFVFCRQVRFKRAGSNDPNDPFIDLFIYEYANCKDFDELNAWRDIRDETIVEFYALNAEDPEKIPLNAYVNDVDASERIQGVYDTFREKAISQGLLATKDEASCIIWGIENVSYDNVMHIIPLDDFKNLVCAEFEDGSFPALRNSEGLLTKHYGDWLSIPEDFKTHRHVQLD